MSEDKVIDIKKKSLFGIAGTFEEWCFIKVFNFFLKKNN